MPRTTQPITHYRDLLYAFYYANKRMPSYSELCTIFSVSSKDTVHRIVQKLSQSNMIAIDATKRIIPLESKAAAVAFTKKRSQSSQSSELFQNLRSPLGIPLLGLVEAGFPSPAEEDLSSETISLDDWIITKREASFMLRVKGDSMYDAGIRDGDMVIVERGSDPKPGDIVIARTHDGYTMKYLRKHSGKNSAYYLEPANADFPIIEEADIIEFAAVVKGVVRRY